MCTAWQDQQCVQYRLSRSDSRRIQERSSSDGFVSDASPARPEHLGRIGGALNHFPDLRP